MLKADFPRKRQNSLSAEQQEKNNALAERYNKNGYFPFVVVMDKDGHVMGETGYKKMSQDKSDKGSKINDQGCSGSIGFPQSHIEQ